MNKRGLSLFLALALCLTLLPAAAFASGEPETSTPHTHYLCGNGEACSHVGGHNETDKTTFATAIRQTEKGYVYVGNGTQEQPNQCVLSEGTYYLATGLVLKGPPNLKKVGCIYIDSDVTLCLNGHTITIIDDRDAFDIRRSLEGNPPTLTLTDCKNSGKITHGASNGTKYLGNGVSLHKSCNFIMYGGSITGNTTTGGENTTWRSGGVWVQDNSTFTMYGGSITDNTTVWNGGGVYVEGSGKFYMHGGEISGNSASSNSGSSGGGVHIGSGTFTMTGGTISGNSASNNGGGVHIGGGSTFTMTGGSITGNNAGTGGSVYVGSDVGHGNSILTLSGAVQITGNKQGSSAGNVYLRSGKTITIGSGHLTDGASIGVTTQNPPANEDIAIATGANLDDKQYFHSDTDENYRFYVTSDGAICMTTANAHGHPICGASCSHNGSSHTDQNWQPIGSAEELTAIQNGGYYYLADDVTLSDRSVWEPPSDTFLCLNGHTITGAAGKDTINVGSGRSFILTDCKGSGKITHGSSDAVGCGVKVIGSFTMYGGSITGNHNSDGGGVRVENTGSFTMYGGSITGNSVSGSGGGVYVSAQGGTQQGRFAMYGGSITGNNASSFGSGGVCVYGTMTVSGSVRITDNVNGGSKGDNGIYTGGTASNVRLVGRTTITIDGPLTEGSQIGVSLYSNRIFTSGWSTNMSDKTFSSYFTADDSSSTVALENGELKLSNPHTHTWTYTASGTTITATCKNCAENNNTDFHGGSVTIAAPEAGTPTYDGRPKAAAVTVSDDWPGANANSIRITYKCGETTLSAAPTDAGTYTAGITVGEGEGAVTASVEYTIAPKELADPTIEIASGSVYDGNAKTPNVTVKVELPKNAGETKVEIPVSNVKPGTVAVLVHPDGTEEIVKNSLPTADGIQLTINGSATVKIMDNSKDFIDTRNHWAKDAIDFVSARGLVNGMSDTIYAPNNSTTRAQLWTILARQNDADLTGGSTWYEKAQNWAKAKGISDGANPNGIINRAQMVTMLWRTMGQPAAGSTANFTDVPADAYYADAVSWAVENGITTGVGNGKFDPDAACTRGQIATFLYRYMK